MTLKPSWQYWRVWNVLTWMAKHSVALYVLGAMLSWPLNAGMVYSSFQAPIDGRCNPSWNRRDAGQALVIGGLMSVPWPIGVPMAFCVSGFAEHGIWKGCQE